LKDLEYEPLYNYSQDKEKKHYVILADYVTVEDGTGIVHIAPAFGAEDFQEGKKYGLPVVQLVDEEGHIKPEATPFAGKTFKQADPLIIQDLDDRGLLFRKEMVVHSYPHCWRCDSPLLNYARASWYIKTTDYKDKMLAQNIRMTWFPPQIGAGRFGEWLENNVDWALSRERFWGTPLNIWICEKCEHKESIESIKKLGEMARKPLPDDLDLHRPFVDEIILKCPKCGEDMTRVKEIIDCWFDSGAMPYAQYHYPFEEKENWDKRFPAEFICEGLDQTRGWFYTLLAISTFISGESSYKRVMVNGLILDKNGQKMSGSRGNAADPFKIISQYGADPLRWYLVSVSQPWLPIQFDEEVIGEVSRKLFGTLKNVYSFFSMYANIDDFKPDRELNEVKLELIDRWILSRLNSLIKAVETGMEDYQITKTIRRINDFVIDDLSNWYVRRNRRRFWISGFDESKYAAFYVLWKCLLEITRLIAPVVPMTAEWYWSSLTVNKELSYPESVHLADFPAYSDDYIDLSLEEEMKFAIEITASLRAARNKARLKIRQPLRKAIVVESNRKLGEEIIDIIRKEINIKDIEITADQSKLMDLKGDPNFKKLGPKFGGEAPKIAELIKRLSPGDLSHLKEKGELEVTVEEKQLQLTSDLVIFGTQYSPQYTIVEENELVVGLNTELDDELINEGFAREIVNKIQNSRKNADFKVTDRIVVGLISTMKIQRALEIHGDYIKNETLTEEIKQGELRDAQWKEEWNINGEPAAISLKVFG
ncbi:isoleucine--tRNA ligase, partial [bacterium]|nr:isoleucine--tRNA ligase [bacterium]